MSDPRKPAETFHPGVFIRDELFWRGWSVNTLATMTGMFPDRWETLIAGKRPLTMLDASCLSRVFGTSVEIWTDLQKSFDGA